MPLLRSGHTTIYCFELSVRFYRYEYDMHFIIYLVVIIVVPSGDAIIKDFHLDGENLPPITSITAAINCTISPKNEILRVDYYSYSPSCNGSSAHKIEIEKTQFCYEGCSTTEEEYVYTTCGKPLEAIQNSTWVQTVIFDDERCTK